MKTSNPTRFVQALSLVVLFTAGCGSTSDELSSIRLVDRFAEARVEDSAPTAEPVEPTVWSFSGGTASGGSWRSGPRTAELALTEEGLSGRAGGPDPTVLLERTEPAGSNDQLHEIVIRLRASAGSVLSVTTLGTEGPPSEALTAERGTLTYQVPLVTGDDFQTYTIALDRSMGLGPVERSAVTRVLLRPTDAAGAEFTLESVQLVFRQERLAVIETGIGWHGLSEVWRDTVVSRPPEKLVWTLDLPPDAWLDIAFGTNSRGPVGFDVLIGEPGDEKEALHRETLTTPERWQPRRIDLESWAGRTVELTLAARGEAGDLAFWGSPVVRQAMVVESRPASPARSVVLILADTLRRDHLALYGHERPNTPNLERLAASGVVFRDAIAQGTWTKVSVPSILTSMYPTTHQITSINDRLPSASWTLAETLQNAGFATWASSSVPFSGQLTNLHQGVEVLYESAGIHLPDDTQGKTGRYFVDRLLPWLEDHHDVPFFAFVHAMDPHSPYRPYAPYDTLWSTEEEAQRYEEDLERVKDHITNALLRRFRMPTRSEMEAAGIDIDSYIAHERAWYDASILALDAEVGRVLEALERLGRADDTVVALVSDHGEEFLEHGSHWHGLNVYAEMIEVPLVVSYPGALPGGREVAATVQTIDLMPTILELTGLAIPPTVQGRSLVPLWRGDGGRRKLPAIAERVAQFDESDDANDVFVGSDSIAVVHGDWKLIWNTRRGPGAPEFELYDRASDPLDQKNLADHHPSRVAELKEILDRWRASAIEARLPADADAAAGMSAAELERLRALGYL